MAQITTEIFIQRARAIHGDKYDYSKVEYVNSTTKVCIICPKHGEFLQRPSEHLFGYGCKKCANELASQTKIKGLDKWIQEVRHIHGNKYDYSKVEYRGNSIKVCIICPDHGEFWQTPLNHLHNHGCPKCAHEASAAKSLIWTKEKCFEEAKKYKTKIDFFNANAACYKKCRDMGYFDKMDWFEESRKPTGYWLTEEGKTECFKIAKQYKYRKDFEENHEAVYNVARVYGYIDKMPWLENVVLPAGYWDKEHCAAEAKKYTSRKKFQDGCPSAYKTAGEKGWMDEICSHMEVIGNRFKRCIYAFEFPNVNGKKYVYVGLAGNMKARLSGHKNGRSSVKDFVEQHGLEFPVQIQKTDYMIKEEAKIMEGKVLQEYIDNGWLPLNKAKTGALGGDHLLWTFEAIKELIVKEQVKGRRDLYNRFGGAYNSALIHGWLNELFTRSQQSHPKGYWLIKEHVVAEAKKYSTKYEFLKGNNTAYESAKRNSWLEEFTWFVKKRRLAPNQKWTKEVVFAEAHKYTDRGEFKANSGSAYNVASKNHWLDEMFWLGTKRKSWTKELIFEEARKYPTRKEFIKNAGRAYNLALNNGWIAEIAAIAKW